MLQAFDHLEQPVIYVPFSLVQSLDTYSDSTYAVVIGYLYSDSTTLQSNVLYQRTDGQIAITSAADTSKLSYLNIAAGSIIIGDSDSTSVRFVCELRVKFDRVCLWIIRI